MVVGLTSLATAEKNTDSLKELVKAYEKVSTALVKDDVGAAKKASAGLEKIATATNLDKLSMSVAKFSKAETLKAMRVEYKAVSKELVKLVGNTEGYYVASCPMAKAEWVQTKTKISNPFMGKKMPACGMLKTKR